MALRRLLGCAVILLATQLMFIALARAELLHFDVDTINSVIKATVTEPLSNFRDNPDTTGTFRLLSGEIEGDPKNIAATGKVKLIIDATTYNSGSQMRDRNVLSSTLDTADYPSIEFDSTHIKDIQIVPQGDAGDATVLGNLALHGVTRPISVPLEASLDPDGGFTAWGEFTFDYTDFGIEPPRLFHALPAGKEVKISFRIRARRPGAPPLPTPTATPTGPTFWDDFVNKVLK
jgi:polyisoprenoid-binding protein YceI